jgi:hypothetical protein
VKAVTFRIKFNGFESDTQISEEFLHLNAKGTVAFAAKKFNQSINHRIKQISVVIITKNERNKRKRELPENNDGIGRHDLLCLW